MNARVTVTAVLEYLPCYTVDRPIGEEIQYTLRS